MIFANFQFSNEILIQIKNQNAPQNAGRSFKKGEN